MIVVKAKTDVGGVRETRRLPMSRTAGELPYDELCIMLHRLFRHRIPRAEDLLLRYIDDEGDSVCLEGDSDIAHALSLSSVLKVIVLDKNKPEIAGKGSLTVPDAAQRSSIRESILDLQRRVDDLVKLLDDSDNAPGPQQQQQQPEPKPLKSSEIAEFLPPSPQQPQQSKQQHPQSPSLNRSQHNASQQPPPTTASYATYGAPSGVSASQHPQQQQPQQQPQQQQHQQQGPQAPYPPPFTPGYPQQTGIQQSMPPGTAPPGFGTPSGGQQYTMHQSHPSGGQPGAFVPQPQMPPPQQQQQGYYMMPPQQPGQPQAPMYQQQQYR